MEQKIDVIIPSATLVPQELQHIGKLPGIIYPINHNIVFDYLYEQYKSLNGNIEIICYESKEKIHRRLSSYKDNKIKIKDLEQLDDLGHTLYFALKGKENTVYINFADTIVMDKIKYLEEDTVFYSEDYVSDIWTYFEIENGIITSLIDKKNIPSHDKKKLFVGLFIITDCKVFSECLEKSFRLSEEERKMSTFYYALYLYSKKKKFTSIKVDEWFDIGHADTYYNSKIAVKAREFNRIFIDKERGILRKSSEEKEKFIGEILWYLKLPSDVEYARPRIFSYSTAYSDPYVLMEYYSYHTVHELFLYGDLTYHQWKELFNRIRFVCNDFKRYSVEDEKIKLALEDIYLNKTLSRFDKLKSDERFKNMFKGYIVVNGIKYKSLTQITKILSEYIPKLLYDVSKFNIIHGDLCFANIMVDSNISFIKVIDPRGKFGDFDIYGDTRYELAKLFHSIDGKYDFIIKDLFDIEYDLDKLIITYRVKDRRRDYNLYELFTDVFKEEIGQDLSKIELIEALLFLSMIPLHGESLDHQIAMLSTGLEILNRVIDITAD